MKKIRINAPMKIGWFSPGYAFLSYDKQYPKSIAPPIVVFDRATIYTNEFKFPDYEWTENYILFGSGTQFIVQTQVLTVLDEFIHIKSREKLHEPRGFKVRIPASEIKFPPDIVVREFNQEVTLYPGNLVPFKSTLLKDLRANKRYFEEYQRATGLFDGVSGFAGNSVMGWNSVIIFPYADKVIVAKPITDPEFNRRYYIYEIAPDLLTYFTDNLDFSFVSSDRLWSEDTACTVQKVDWFGISLAYGGLKYKEYSLVALNLVTHWYSIDRMLDCGITREQLSLKKLGDAVIKYLETAPHDEVYEQIMGSDIKLVDLLGEIL